MATIRKRGDYQWQAQVRRKGYPLQTKTFETRRDAEAWSRMIEREMDAGSFVSRSEAERTTISDIATRYREESMPKMKGERQEGQRLKRVVDKFGDYHLSAISSAMVATWRDELAKTLAAQTVVHYLAVLSRLYDAAQRDFGIPLPLGNPVDNVRRPALNNARDRRLDADEEVRLLAALERSRSRWLKPAVLLALETAMRRGELLQLRWADIDLVRQVAHLPDTKNGTSRDVPLTSKAVALLQALPRSIGGRVLPASETALTEGFQRAAAKAGLVDFHFHDLRHEATSRLAEKLGNVLELASVTGHKDLRMLKRYYHPRAEDLARKLG